MTKEQLADAISRNLTGANAQNLFAFFSTAEKSAILQFGASKSELERMYKNILG